MILDINIKDVEILLSASKQVEESNEYLVPGK